MAHKEKLKTIGIIEKINFIDGQVQDLDCKIDTGADTSSVHCERPHLKEIDGEEYLVFTLLDVDAPHYTGVEICTKEFVEIKVKSTIGDFEYRYQVKLSVEFFGKKYKGTFNLSNRSHMKYPVLIGRRFLYKKFLVDVSEKYLSRKK